MNDVDRQSSGTEGTPDEKMERDAAKQLHREMHEDDTAKAVQMMIAHVIHNRGLGHSMETCESLATEIMSAVSALEAL